ncbi:MAG: methyltransferase [Paludibacteraceae bacterium]|nr:methyltransferase [Paludibacteraceae bacterium]
MSSDCFRFKQFEVCHAGCAMKVGTDGVLLGAWASCQQRILDVGTGSGLIALMLAQRFEAAQIDAVDIDGDAVRQATDNFAHSKWSNRLHCRQIAVQDLAKEDVRYDAIVSNPPYFVDSLKNPNLQRQTARHTDTLSYEELLASCEHLLTADGVLSLILPAESEQVVLETAKSVGLYPTRLVHVYSKPGKPVKRILLELQKRNDQPCEESHFYIESATSPRSDEYTALTKDFYL